MKSKTIILASSAIFVSSFIFATVALARSDNSLGRGNDIEASDSSEPTRSPKASFSPGFKNTEKLTANRLRVCQVHEKEIKKRAESLLKLVTGMLGKFDSIALRVKAYYLSSGKTVTNYDTLIAEIDAKNAAVDVALAAAQTDVDNFTCDGTNPKGQLSLFRIDMQKVKLALHAYRTSIKNLIVAVRGVVKDNEGETGATGSGVATSTPTTTATPTATPIETPTVEPSPTTTP